jgi:hypothetical protein
MSKLTSVKSAENFLPQGLKSPQNASSSKNFEKYEVIVDNDCLEN